MRSCALQVTEDIACGPGPVVSAGPQLGGWRCQDLLPWRRQKLHSLCLTSGQDTSRGSWEGVWKPDGIFMGEGLHMLTTGRRGIPVLTHHSSGAGAIPASLPSPNSSPWAQGRAHPLSPG